MVFGLWPSDSVSSVGPEFIFVLVVVMFLVLSMICIMFISITVNSALYFSIFCASYKVFNPLQPQLMFEQ